MSCLTAEGLTFDVEIEDQGQGQGFFFLLRNEGLRPNIGFKQHIWIRNIWWEMEIAKAQSMEIFHDLLEHTVGIQH